MSVSLDDWRPLQKRDEVIDTLHAGWTLTCLGGPVPGHIRDKQVPASVPGSVLTDLLAAGLIADPYIDGNEKDLAWLGRTSWRFETMFHHSAVEPGERCDLVCLGLDTVATLRLNGKEMGRTQNMHRSYRFDATKVLRAGPNVLQIDFAAPWDAAEAMSRQLGERPNNSGHPFNAIRKMACSFGWDWGPDLPTAGIWRPVGLERWRQARIAGARPLVHVSLPEVTSRRVGWPSAPADASAPQCADAEVEVHVTVERAEGLAEDQVPLLVVANVAGESAEVSLAPGEGEAVVRLAVPQVRLWWPAGYGEQPLYEIDLALFDHRDDARTAGPLARWDGRVGFRSVEIDTTRDDKGRRLALVVNGRTVLVRGANWIPDDCFPSRVTPERYRSQLQAAKQANCNLLRVWGGGIYEDEAFYEIADELGLLVWQDFMLACAAYAEEEPLRSELEAEAREAVGRLSAHASVAVWSGGNECLWLHDEWDWDSQLDGKTWGPGYYFEMFPSIVAELDPTRPYMPGSPWSFDDAVHPNDDNFGSKHVWDVWNEQDYSAYRKHQPRFVAEFGFQGPPSWPTLARSVTARPLSVGLPALGNHQKANDGMLKLERGLVAHFPPPRSFEDWHWATSLNQARAISLAVEYWRSLTPRCQGTIVWQLNDCWPVISWSAIDGDHRRKPMWYALRRAYADRLLTFQPASGPSREEPSPLQVVAVNDSCEPWEARVVVRRQGFDGTTLAEQVATVVAQPGQPAVLALATEVAMPDDPRREVVVACAGEQRALWYFLEDKDLLLPAPALRARVEEAEGGFDVVLEASDLQRDIAVLADRVEPSAVCDDMLITLLAGEQRRVHIRTAGGFVPGELLAAEVLRSANQLCAPKNT